MGITATVYNDTMSSLHLRSLSGVTAVMLIFMPLSSIAGTLTAAAVAAALLKWTSPSSSSPLCPETKARVVFVCVTHAGKCQAEKKAGLTLEKPKLLLSYF